VRILVTAASRHGSTAQIAARIGQALRAGLPCGAVVQVTAAAQISDMAVYDAIVLGSAVYMGRWLPEAREAGRLDRHQLGFAEKAMVMALRVPADESALVKEPSAAVLSLVSHSDTRQDRP
jgi:menaquinone-dependent protoporphyrinogen IX oxidase